MKLTNEGTLYHQGEISCPHGMPTYIENTGFSTHNQNTPQGQINEIMPPEDESYNKAIDSILKCISVLECCIDCSVAKENEVELLVNDICECLCKIFDNCVFNYNSAYLYIDKYPFLCCSVLLQNAFSAISNCPILKNAAEFEEVCKGLIYLCNVFSSGDGKLTVYNVISFSNFSNVVDVAFNLCSFLIKHSMNTCNVFYKSIYDGFVYKFFSNLFATYIPVNKVMSIEKLDVSKESIYEDIEKNIFKDTSMELSYISLRNTMLYYYDFHKMLVHECGEKVKFEQGTDFHSLFIYLIKELCYVYNIFNEVIIKKTQIHEFKKICDVETFKNSVNNIKNNITEIFNFFINSNFLNKNQVVIDKCKIKNVFISKDNENDEGTDKFSGLVRKITERKMYENMKKINNLGHFNYNYNPLFMNYINNDYFLNNDRFGKEGNVKKPLEDIIDDVTSNHSSCCSCQRRRQ